MAGTIPIHISTRAKEYPSPAGKEPEVPSSAPPSSSGPLHIERPITEMVIWPPPKGVLWKSSYNPNARAAQRCSIVEDLAQAPSAMSALEVLQSCPSQRKSLLSTISGIDPVDSDLITNFRSHFEAKWCFFWEKWKNMSFCLMFSSKVVFLRYILIMRYCARQTKIVCQRYNSGKLMYQFT